MKATFCALAFLLGLCPSSEPRAVSQDADPAAWLKHDVGQWNVEVKMWLPGENGEPFVFQGTENNEMLGDNWIISKFTGNFGGQAFQGHAVYGFDVKKDAMVATWVDSVNGFMSQYEGAFDAASQSVVLTGKEIDPANGELVDGKQVRSFKDDDIRTIVSYQKPVGADDFIKITETTLTRRK